MELKKLIKNHKIPLLIIVLLIGVFYWYGVKPSSIKNKCSEIAEEKINRTRIRYGRDEAKKAIDYNAFYQQCLQKEGL